MFAYEPGGGGQMDGSADQKELRYATPTIPGLTGIETVDSISAQIAELAVRLSKTAVATPSERAFDAKLVRSLITVRRNRANFFGPVLFADPAWDMLLDLVAARLERRLVSVSSLCLAAGVPTTTALRWMRSMQKSGIIIRQSDPDDGRRSFVGLSKDAFSMMIEYLHQSRAALIAANG